MKMQDEVRKIKEIGGGCEMKLVKNIEVCYEEREKIVGGGEGRSF